MKITAIILLLGIIALLFWFLARRFERSQMYFPQAILEFKPSDIGLSYQDIYLSASDGVRLHGWWIPASPSRGTVLFCHGNAGNISHRLESIRIFNALGLDVFIFDYRGYGNSSGQPSEEGTYRDAEAAYSYLTDELQISPERIIIFGRSLGGAVAVELAQKIKAGALICESLFTSAEDMGRMMYPYLPVKLIISNKYDSISKVGKISIPKLFIHSSEDEMIPFEQGKKLFEASAPPKEFLEIRGSHGDGFRETGERYHQGIRNFLLKYLPA